MSEAPPAHLDEITLELLAEGELAPPQVGEHLANCPACAERLAALKRNNDLLAQCATVRPPAHDPPTIDGYELRGEIHRGAQGVVLRAWHERLRREVAVKILGGGSAASTRQRLRFQREMELLASLRHPDIVTIYDSGTTRYGQLYLSMELVEGVTLDEWANQMRRDTHALLAMLARIARAVSHAHQRGVIHRDLKPANVLVTAQGDPKLVDFGVARVEDPRDMRTIERTEVGQIIGTLAYMSPEQARGDPGEIDARADIYALGVIGYELLAGARPLDLEGCSLTEALRRIESSDPRPLAHRRRDLRGDVETIIRKALSKERSHRYQSASEMADDLDRYHRDEPISARPPTTREQLRRLAKRHRAFVVGSGAVLVVLIGGLFGMTWLAIERDRARGEAVGALGESEGATLFLERAIEKVDPEALGRDVLLRDALQAASVDVGEELGGAPRVASRVRQALGQAFAALGDLSEAEHQLRTALEIREKVLGRDAPGTIDLMRRLALLLLDSQDRFGEAESILIDALARATSSLEPDDPVLLNVHDAIGLLRMYQRRLDEAEASLRMARAGWVQRHEQGSKDALDSFSNLAVVLMENGKAEECGRALGELVDGYSQLRGPESDDALIARFNEGMYHLELGHREKGIRQMVAIAELQRASRANLTTEAMLTQVAEALIEERRLNEARQVIEQILELSRAMRGPDHPRAWEIARRHADVLARMGEVDRALLTYDACLEALERLYSPEHEEVARALLGRAEVLRRMGRTREALDDTRRGADLYARLYDDPCQPNAVRACLRYAAVSLSGGDTARALTILTDRLARITESDCDADWDGDARLTLALATTRACSGDSIAAAEIATRALPMLSPGLLGSHGRTAAHQILALAALTLNDYVSAIHHAELMRGEVAHPSWDWHAAQFEFVYALVLAHIGRAEEAAAFARSAATNLAATLGPSHRRATRAAALAHSLTSEATAPGEELPDLYSPLPSDFLLDLSLDPRWSSPDGE